MVSLLQVIHNVKQLVIDVKPENFMFTRAASARQSLESRLRLVDFGLMRAFARPEVRQDLQGNAMYASLHMHTLHNISRRDDVEMICYVLGEMVIRLHALANGTAAVYERSSIPSYLCEIYHLVTRGTLTTRDS
jgi:serine/threonine protein kinase